MADEMTDPAAQPTIWVSKWVDYSDKYGFGYQLSDDTVGVMFNDTTRLMIISNGKYVAMTVLGSSRADWLSFPGTCSTWTRRGARSV